MNIEDFKNKLIVLINPINGYFTHKVFNLGIVNNGRLFIGMQEEDHDIYSYDIYYMSTLLLRQKYITNMTSDDGFKSLDCKCDVLCRMYESNYKSNYVVLTILTDEEGILLTNHAGLIVPVAIVAENESVNNDLLDKIYRALGN